MSRGQQHTIKDDQRWGEVVTARMLTYYSLYTIYRVRQKELPYLGN